MATYNGYRNLNSLDQIPTQRQISAFDQIPLTTEQQVSLAVPVPAVESQPLRALPQGQFFEQGVTTDGQPITLGASMPTQGINPAAPQPYDGRINGQQSDSYQLPEYAGAKPVGQMNALEKFGHVLAMTDPDYALKYEQQQKQRAVGSVFANPALSPMEKATVLAQIDPNAYGEAALKLQLQEVDPDVQLDRQYKQAQLAKVFADIEQSKRQSEALKGLSGSTNADRIFEAGAATGNPALISLADRMQTRQDQVATKKDEKIDSQVEKYAKTADEFSTFANSLKEFRKTIDQYEGKDIPAIGAGGMLPGFALDDEGRDVRTQAASLGNQLIQLRTGAAMGVAESQRLAAELGLKLESDGSVSLDGFKTDDQLRTGIKNVTKQIDAKINNAAAGVSPEALARYKERGGNVFPGMFGEAQQQQFSEGQTRRNRRTGEVQAFVNGQWVSQ